MDMKGILVILMGGGMDGGLRRGQVPHSCFKFRIMYGGIFCDFIPCRIVVLTFVFIYYFASCCRILCIKLKCEKRDTFKLRLTDTVIIYPHLLLILTSGPFTRLPVTVSSPNTQVRH